MKFRQILLRYFFIFLVQILFLSMLGVFIQSPVQAQQRSPFAQGNLFVVFNPKSGRSSYQNPQLAYLNSLWCQATLGSTDRLRIKSARFMHVSGGEHPHPARLNKEKNRAYLEFGQAQITSIGKYRCEITLDDDNKTSGNLFVYMRPVFNTTMRLMQLEEGNNFDWIAPLMKVTAGDEANIECPAIGYPLPEISWLKNNVPINTDATLPQSSTSNEIQKKYLLEGQLLKIRGIEATDEGIYKCKATNSFALTVDQDYRKFHLSLKQELMVSNSYSWLIPLLVILVCIILLVLIIWGCSAWQQYKHKQYNVAQKEKEFGQKGVDAQKLPLESEDAEE